MNWVGFIGVVVAFAGILGILALVYYDERLPWMEKAWPSLLITFGTWVIWRRRFCLRIDSWLSLAVGILARGVQLLLNREDWTWIGMSWPLALLYIGTVWVMVASPASPKKSRKIGATVCSPKKEHGNNKPI